MTERTEDMDSSDLRSRVVNLEHAAASKELRITTLEQWRVATDLIAARKDVAWENLVKTVDTVEKKIDGMAGNLTWIVRLVLGGIILGIIAFLFKGGFQVP